mmetsp:Transcript_14703/g.44852  ORF Transcript_14703/g.44852 Transcript_14703/m.44852 type:complete len:625 (+) Transcript_14703:51-1925(+)
MTYKRVSQVGVENPFKPSPPSKQDDDGTYVGHGGEGHRFRNGKDAAPSPGDTVIIVGGGPSGIHMASVLKEIGVNPIVVESEPRVGGKSYTVQIDGLVHEMGTCYIHPEYHVPKAMFKKYGMAEDQIRPGGDISDRDFYFDSTNMHEANHFDSLATWNRAAAREKMIRSGKWYANSLPDLAVSVAFLSAARKYQRLHSEIMGTYHGMFPPRPSPEKWEELAMPFGQWLDKHDLSALIPVLIVGHTVQGYGLMSSVPTFYGLLWFTADLMEAFVAYASDRKNAEPVLTMLRGGWSKLWQRMVEQDQLDVRLGHKVTSIDRSSTGVLVRGVASRIQGGGCGGGKATFTLKGTHVFIACSYTALAKAMKLTPEERRIIDGISPLSLTTTLYERHERSNRLASEPSISYWPDRADPHTENPYSMGINCERWSEKSIRAPQDLILARSKAPTPVTPGQKILANFERELDVKDLATNAAPHLGSFTTDPKKRVCVAYQCSDKGKVRTATGAVDTTALASEFLVDMEKQGVTGVNVLLQCPWDFNSYDARGLKDGLPWDLLEMQGDNRTFWIGACACLESVNDVTNYNVELIHHFYGPARAKTGAIKPPGASTARQGTQAIINMTGDASVM